MGITDPDYPDTITVQASRRAAIKALVSKSILATPTPASTTSSTDLLLAIDFETGAEKLVPISEVSSSGISGNLYVTGLGIGSAATSVIPVNVYTQYVNTGISNALSIGNKNIKSLVNVGVANGAAATGSVLGFDVSVVVGNTSQAGAEHCPMFAVLRYDQGTGFANSGTPGRGWLTDWTVHGAIGVQQEVLNGVNLVMANYYNGQPIDSPSGGVWIAAHPDIGGAVDATHAAATTYPNGVGLAVVGVSSGSARGWNTGIQVGGSGSGWEVAASRVGTGIDVRDHDTRGIYIRTANVSTAHALDIDSDAGNVVIGGTQTLDGTNYTEPKVAIARVNTAFGTGIGQGNAHHLFAFSTSNVAADTGASIGLGGRTDNTGPVIRAFGYIAGRKTNGNTSDSSGYLQFGTHKNGVGMREWLRVSEDGLFTFSDAANLAFNATTGTKIATATTQKLAFWNTTPIVQPTTAFAAATFVVGSGTAVNDASTFDGYTIKQIVKIIRSLGLAA